MKSIGSTSTNKRSETGQTEALQLLYQKGDLSSSQLKTLKKFMTTWSVGGLEAVLDTHMISEEALADSLAKHLKLERIHNVKGETVFMKVLEAVPFADARSLCCLPIEWIVPDRHLKLVVADPTCSVLKKSLETNLSRAKGQNLEITLAIGERRDILSAIDLLYPLSLQLYGSSWLKHES